MASNVTFLREVQRILGNISRVLQRWNARPPLEGMFAAPALAFDSPVSYRHQTSRATPSSPREIFNGILNYAVPKARRSAEKRMTRRFGHPHFKQFTETRNDLISCLVCGNWHESSAICGNCYEKVRDETKAMRQTMGKDQYEFNHPQTEVVYLYEGEEAHQPKHEGKHIVQMKKPKPSWFPKYLTEK